MCGRYDLSKTPREVASLFGASGAVPNFPARYNIAPTQSCPVVRRDWKGGREIAMLRWGLIPSWAKDAKIGYSTINARAETVASKPAFRAAFRQRRCLVPATGYYEWQVTKDGKQPWRFVPADEPLFAFAGLWERWDRGDEQIESFSVIVTEANEMARRIHERMPVIVNPEHFEAWLGASDTAIPLALLQPHPAGRMRAYPVSKRVGNPRNDDPSLIEPAEP